MKFEIWQGEDELWYWHLQATNHEIIAAGEGYKNKADCLNAISLIQSTSKSTPVVESV
jgi:uncharacterized protein